MALFLCILVLAANVANAERRVALLIGNDGYTDVPPLQKAVADAETVAATMAFSFLLIIYEQIELLWSNEKKQEKRQKQPTTKTNHDNHSFTRNKKLSIRRTFIFYGTNESR